MKMGCCFSCNDDDDQGGSEIGDNERRPLLNPVSNSSPVMEVPRSDSLTVTTTTGQSVRGQEDELAKILQETASAMIDVSCAGSHSLDQREFQERTRNYLHKIQTLNPTLLLNPQPIQPEATASITQTGNQSTTAISSSPMNSSCLQSAAAATNALVNPILSTGLNGGVNMLLGDVPNPEKHLGIELISEEDVELMNSAMDDIEQAMHSIRIEYDEELVVPFGSEYGSEAASPASGRMVMVSD